MKTPVHRIAITVDIGELQPEHLTVEVGWEGKPERLGPKAMSAIGAAVIQIVTSLPAMRAVPLSPSEGVEPVPQVMIAWHYEPIEKRTPAEADQKAQG